jgi:hypothetical protein
MAWLHYVAYFFGGVFSANALPHLMAGVTGKSMPTPFASPPFRGQSSPVVNVAWALVNLFIAYALLGHVGYFAIKRWSHGGVSFFGFAAMALLCARSMTRLNNAGA